MQMKTKSKELKELIRWLVINQLTVVCDLMHFLKLYYLAILRFHETPAFVSAEHI